LSLLVLSSLILSSFFLFLSVSLPLSLFLFLSLCSPLSSSRAPRLGGGMEGERKGGEKEEGERKGGGEGEGEGERRKREFLAT